MPPPSPTCRRAPITVPRPAAASSRGDQAQADHRRARHRGRTDGRIHTTYVQTGSQTGRLSSTDPNLQNIPIRTEESRRIRAAFEVGEGYETLLTADYSQIEMRIMAHLSGDPGLIEAFNSGEDLHRFVGGARVRRRAAGRHARDAHQGQGDVVRARLRPVGVRPVEAAAHRAVRGQETHARVLRPVRRGARLPARLGRAARQDGYTETIFGRRRPFPI